MIPEFIIATSPFLLSLKRTTALWYVHKSVTWKLKIAERLVDYVFTASPLSFRLPSKKVIYTGHAIDTEFLKPEEGRKRSATLRLLALGRISPVKDYETIIRACAMLKSVKRWKLSIVGGPIMKRDEAYIASLRELVRQKGLGEHVEFAGPRPYAEVPEILRNNDIFITMSNTGSIDKAVLEAMSTGLNVIVANEAFKSMLPDASFIVKRSPELLAERITALASAPYPNTALREIVVREHSLDRTVQKITDYLSGADI
jgi:glycosyltransferase involved in cell wall biosynthesis